VIFVLARIDLTERRTAAAVAARRGGLLSTDSQPHQTYMMISIPLSDALPWDRTNPPSHGCLFVVTDSIETDGRFLLHTLAAQYLSSNKVLQREGHRGGSRVSGGRSNDYGSSTTGSTSASRNTSIKSMSTTTACGNKGVLWISCGAYSEQNIVSAIKKIGTKEGMTGMDRLSSSASWEYISACDEIVSSVANDCDTEGKHCDEIVKRELLSSSYVKTLYERIKGRLTNSGECNNNEHGNTTFCWLVVLDDVSILSQLLGTYALLALIQRIRAIIQSQGGCFIIRTSNEAEREHIQMAASTKEYSSTTSPQWVGAGGGDTVFDNVRFYPSVELQHQFMSWNNILSELADGIIDVMPLQSGFSREAHGRLLCTEILGGRGWVDGSDSIRSGYTKTATSFNYLCSESDIKAIHLGSKT